MAGNLNPQDCTEPVPKLFQPVRVGDITLGHRIVMALLTCHRADKDHVHTDLGVTYYAQHASVPGTLLITEATFIAPFAGLYTQVPGIWKEAQVVAWKKGTSACSHDHSDTEIKEYVDAYAQAARNVVHGAGFDGVEVHCANGYLLDQFLQDTSNNRTDDYGGSIENRYKFPLEAIRAAVEAVGQRKVGLRISPWGALLGMRMTDPISTFSYFVSKVAELYPDFTYVHIVEPFTRLADTQSESNDFIRKIWLPRTLISAGGYTRESAIKCAEETGELIAFGKVFIANPDLPHRLRHNLPLNQWDRTLFFAHGNPHGYIDYPFAEGDSSQHNLH
ncbi:hypothetical protein BN946_scf184902.g25 [Trametes cinnabarina]|uniref:NADH:flavin oxidoreductase/NADH oxidase N-terminal domain-containing protein n=1 Tax=Pycnoporus cinnabarinus TaxID=5643 RepID=A0A060STM2_PYCCI|nr:hypothetical protein BN946_scf184902.g25 [Trametes cinnabarina]